MHSIGVVPSLAAPRNRQLALLDERPRLCSADAGRRLSRAWRHALDGTGAAWRESGRQTRDRPGNERGTPKRVCEAAGYAGQAFRAGYRSRSGRPETSKPSRAAAGSCFATVMAGKDASSGFEFRSRFDDMPGGARGFGVNGQGKGGGKVNIALYAEPEGSPVFGQFEQTD